MPDSIALRGLRVVAGDRDLVRGVDLELRAGEVLGLVGASGCGKSLTARSLLGLVDLSPGVVAADLEIRLGDEILRPYEGCLGGGSRERDRAFRSVRGAIVGYLPQDARASLDPLFSVGRQVRSAARLGPDGPGADPLPWLTRAGLRDAVRVASLYAHELSGGMAQRVAIAQSLARGSRFLLADEPTTGLDLTVQRAILDEIRALADQGIGVLLITHDLAILPGLADRIAILDGGTVVERATPEALASGRLTSEPGRRLVEATRAVAGGRLG